MRLLQKIGSIHGFQDLGQHTCRRGPKMAGRDLSEGRELPDIAKMALGLAILGSEAYLELMPSRGPQK